MIIAINGKAGSGKDTVGKIVQYLIAKHEALYTYPDTVNDLNDYLNHKADKRSSWHIHRFADKLKQVVSLFTGIPIEDLEKEEVKNSVLPACWDKYGYADGFTRDENDRPIMTVKYCSKEEYEIHRRINWQTAYHYQLTVRDLLQDMGTNALRNIVHDDIHVNGLFVDYKPIGDLYKDIEHGDIKIAPVGGRGYCGYPGVYENLNEKAYPSWLIPDLRFKNEGQAVKDRQGVCIRVHRDIDLIYPELWDDFVALAEGGDFMNFCKHCHPKVYRKMTHQSEVDLDDTPDGYFNFELNNSSTIDDLIANVKNMLIELKIIK